MPERNDALRLAVFKDGEGTSVQVGHNVIFTVDHRGMEHDLVHVFADDEGSIILILLRWRRRSCRWGLRRWRQGLRL